MSRRGLTFDLFLCIGCDACAEACRAEHLVPFDMAWLTVEKHRNDGELEPTFVHRLCMHCEAPACLAACETGALFFDAGRIVQIDDAACTGCGACIESCPFDVLAVPSPARVLPKSSFLSAKQEQLRARWARRAEKNIPSKCDLCFERRCEGRQPACVVACPVHAIVMVEADPAESVHVRFIGPSASKES